MIKLNEQEFRDDMQRIKLWLSHARHEVPFAIAYTLTLMAKAGKGEMVRQLPRYFDRPTRWTMNSILLKMATKQDQTAEVSIKDQSRAHMLHHITGGKRPEKGYEHLMRQAGILKGSNQYTVPAKRLKLDQYGNIGMSRINKILSAVGAQFDTYSNTTASSIKRNKGQSNYFLLNRQNSTTPPGIYETRGSGFNKQLQPVMIFLKKTQYKRRLPFFEVVEDSAYDAMPAAVDKAINRVMFGSNK